MVMEKYELRLPKTVFSGVNALNKIGDIVKGTYKKVAIFTDKGIEKAGLLEEPLKIIKSKSLEVEILNSIPSEPYQLSPRSIGISPLPTSHPKAFQRSLVRSSTHVYLCFNLDMGRSLWFRFYSN